MVIICALISFALLGGAVAQLPSFGQCPEVQTAMNLDLHKYMGRWYETQRYFAALEIGAKCVMSDYSQKENKTINIVHSKLWLSASKPWITDMSARVPDPTNPAKLKIKLSIDPIGIERDYWILGTDYDNYAVVYSCLNIKLMNFKHLWILTRQQHPPQEVIDQAIEVVQANHLDGSRLRTISQTCE